MKLMWFYHSHIKGMVLLGLVFKTVASIGELLIPFLLSHILDNVIETTQLDAVIFYGVLMIVCALLVCVFHLTSNHIVAKITRVFSKELRRDLFKKTIYLSAHDTDRFTIPSLESRITTDTYHLHNFSRTMQRIGFRAPLMLIGGLIISFIMDAYLAGVMLAMLPFIFIIVYTISRKGVPLYRKVQQSVDSMIRVVREDTQGVRVIKALSKTEYENARYDAVNLGLSKDERRAGLVISTANPTMTLLMNLGITAVIALSASRIAAGTSTPGTDVAFMQYFTQISMALMSISRLFVLYSKCSASANRISEVLDTPDTFHVTEPAVTGDMQLHIEFEDVSFSYLGKKNNLENISFSLPHGGTLGIIGATGSGKSTLIKLLLRFYEIDSGTIRINGRDITSYTRDELTSMFGVALQNDFLFADTIEENISFGRDLPHEAVVRAAKIAQAADFIEALPDGYNHVLAPKGNNLSGGQRQRLLIARAIAAQPAILILDDSSSALDYKTDANLRQELSAQLSESTVITVAQRVSSVKNCDLILVFDDGRIIGRGTHEELLATCAEYREISESQMGGVFVD